MLPTINPFPTNNRNRPRPINPTDSAATTGLLSNPNGTYISNPFPTTAQNGAQGAFGAMLPQVNVQNPNSPLFNAIQSGALNTTPVQPFKLPPVTQMPGLLTGNLTVDQLNQIAAMNQPQTPRPPYANQPGSGSNSLPRPGTPESLALVNRHAQAQEEMLVNSVISAVESGDYSALSQLPASDLEAMGLGEFAGMGGGGGTQGANESDSDYVKRMTGIGTGVDEGKDMTPAQLEERYYKNKAIEAEFLRAKRWDAKRKRYITVGQWMKQERNKYNKKGRRRSGGGGGRPPVIEQPKEEQPQYTIQQAGTVNFNTATG
jgi:hypothetical protein